MNQSHGTTVWTEPRQSGATPVVAEAHLVADGIGGYTVEDVSVGNPTAARMLADAYGGFTMHDGPTNPSALAEKKIVDVRGAFQLY